MLLIHISEPMKYCTYTDTDMTVMLDPRKKTMNDIINNYILTLSDFLSLLTTFWAVAIAGSSSIRTSLFYQKMIPRLNGTFLVIALI